MKTLLLQWPSLSLVLDLLHKLRLYYHHNKVKRSKERNDFFTTTATTDNVYDRPQEA